MSLQINQKTSHLFHVLIVDDDPLIHQAFKVALPATWKMTSARTPEEVPDQLFFHAAFVDMHLESNSQSPHGPEIIRFLSGINTQTEIIGMSGDLRIELMEKCLKLGAQKFLAKPLIKDDILLILDRIEAFWKIRTNSYLQNQRQIWIGESEKSVQIQRQIAQLKGSQKPILITGPTGAGKEVVARLLNLQEPQRPWIAVNLGAIPENLFESEFFGHVKGAFTGADQNKIGLVEAANGGDLFLDEVEALSLHHQAKFLRFLESYEYRKVGSTTTARVQVRIICATNRKLKEMIAAGEFREDLYFRLCSQLVEIPMLTARKEDIPQLANWFLQSENRHQPKTLSEDALESLKSYHWPGNVRELKRICEQLALFAPLPIIRAADVQMVLPRNLEAPTLDGFTQYFDPHWESPLGLDEKVQRFEALLIKNAIKKFGDVE